MCLRKKWCGIEKHVQLQCTELKCATYINKLILIAQENEIKLHYNSQMSLASCSHLTHAIPLLVADPANTCVSVLHETRHTCIPLPIPNRHQELQVSPGLSSEKATVLGCAELLIHDAPLTISCCQLL